VSQAASSAVEPRIIGRYALFDEIASGGMATVHLGRLLGPVGFGRTVAIKRLHEHYLKDPEFVTMFMDEARIVARIRHPNVVPMIDVVQSKKGIFLIMEYVHGESLSRLLRASRTTGQKVPIKVVAAILYNVLLGLHAAHETKGTNGELLDVVHRDVSPQNVIVGADGVARMLDFGIAKAAGRAQITREGQIKGKLAYMAPEQIRGQVDRRTDVFSAAVVLWEALAGRRLHEGLKEIDIVTRVVKGAFDPPSMYFDAVPKELDAITLKGLSPKPSERFASAREMALEIEQKVGLASPREVSEWVEGLAKGPLEVRAAAVDAMERRAVDLVPTSEPPPAIVPEAKPAPEEAALPIDVDPIDTSSTVTPMDARANGVFIPSRPRLLEQPRFVVAAAGVFTSLAVIGIVLGGYALHRRAQAPAEASRSAGPPPVEIPVDTAVAPTEVPPVEIDAGSPRDLAPGTNDAKRAGSGGAAR
jgi:serine/threonine-protein kinase